jgi:hypothetical protein
MARHHFLAGGLLLALTGCTAVGSLFDEEKSTSLAWNDPGPDGPAAVRKVNYAPASQETAWRVDAVGRSLLGANAPYGLKPLFATVGTKDPEVFHVGGTTLYVTEGLVRQCKTDAELAAVLASELGKMVAEREARAGKDVRDPDRLPPVRLPIGANGFGNEAADPTNFIEQARFEQRYPRNRQTPRPDPQAVARTLLEQGGYKAADLDAAQPLLQAAARTGALENQFKGAVKPADWRP